MGTAIKHPVPDRVKPSFVIFDIRALWRSGTHMATVGFKGLTRPTAGSNLSQIYLRANDAAA